MYSIFMAEDSNTPEHYLEKPTEESGQGWRVSPRERSPQKDSPNRLFKSFLSGRRERRPILEVKPSISIRPPSYRPLPEVGGFERQTSVELASLLQSLLGELQGRRAGYEFYPDPAERQELVEISEKTADYLHDNEIRNFILLDRSARPAYIGVKEVWKKKYPDKPLPDIYFVNPTGFMNDKDALAPGMTGLPKGMEIMFDGQRKGNDVGDAFTEPRPQEDIEKDFTETYKRLTENRDQPTLLFDTCVHSGDSLRPVQTTLQNLGFNELKVGVVGEDMNTSDIKPDFIAVQGTPLGVCYPFDRDRMVERRFDSVTSRPTTDTISRERGIALRNEIRSIVTGTPLLTASA